MGYSQRNLCNKHSNIIPREEREWINIGLPYAARLGDCMTAAVSHLAPKMSVTIRNRLKEGRQEGITKKLT